ncbi:MAG: dipeptidase E [Rhodothermales bacterium]|jgi:dipeptidase E
MNLILLSNSRNPGSGYLEHALEWVSKSFHGVKKVAFVPYAGVRVSYDDYEKIVADAFSALDMEVVSVHRSARPAEVVESCDAVAVGGGNTFHLLERMYATGMMDAIRTGVQNGMPYAGWSAGSNVACPGLWTTNDMPIIEPPSMQALGLVPFQINPHYLDAHPDGHMGETREQRILEFVQINREMPVVGLREGSALFVNGREVRLLGPRSARIFRGVHAPEELPPGATLNFPKLP